MTGPVAAPAGAASVQISRARIQANDTDPMQATYALPRLGVSRWIFRPTHDLGAPLSQRLEHLVQQPGQVLAERAVGIDRRYDGVD